MLSYKKLIIIFILIFQNNTIILIASEKRKPTDQNNSSCKAKKYKVSKDKFLVLKEEAQKSKEALEKVRFPNEIKKLIGLYLSNEWYLYFKTHECPKFNNIEIQHRDSQNIYFNFENNKISIVYNGYIIIFDISSKKYTDLFDGSSNHYVKNKKIGTTTFFNDDPDEAIDAFIETGNLIVRHRASQQNLLIEENWSPNGNALLDFTHDSKLFAATCDKNLLKIWDIKRYKEIFSKQLVNSKDTESNYKSILGLTFLRNNNLISFITVENYSVFIKILNIISNRYELIEKISDNCDCCFTFSQDDLILAIKTYNSLIIFKNAQNILNEAEIFDLI